MEEEEEDAEALEVQLQTVASPEEDGGAGVDVEDICSKINQ